MKILIQIRYLLAARKRIRTRKKIKKIDRLLAILAVREAHLSAYHIPGRPGVYAQDAIDTLGNVKEAIANLKFTRNELQNKLRT